LLLSDKFSEGERKGAGWALATVGALTTIPIAMNIFKKPTFREKLAA
jgi:hypothetical protein